MATPKHVFFTILMLLRNFICAFPLSSHEAASIHFKRKFPPPSPKIGALMKCAKNEYGGLV